MQRRYRVLRSRRGRLRQVPPSFPHAPPPLIRQHRRARLPRHHRRGLPPWLQPASPAGTGPAAAVRRRRDGQFRPHRRRRLLRVPAAVPAAPGAVFTAGAARGLWIGGGVPSYTQSVLSTQYVQVPVTVRSPSPYDPTGDAVQFAFVPVTYPQAAPSVWYAGSWSVFPGPAYWAQVLVGPASGGVALAAGSYEAWVKITDNPEIPVLQPFILTITP